jgi:hypothetical protein
VKRKAVRSVCPPGAGSRSPGCIIGIHELEIIVHFEKSKLTTKDRHEYYTLEICTLLAFLSFNFPSFYVTHKISANNLKMQRGGLNGLLVKFPGKEAIIGVSWCLLSKCFL